MANSDTAEAFDAFYRAEWGRLAGTLRLLSGDDGLADEVAQEAFTKAWLHWRRGQAMERPAGWVYVTAFRLLRRRTRARVPTGDTGLDDRIDLDVTDRVALQRALAALPARKRQAVVARHVLGFDGPDAAALLGMQPAGFRQLLSRAMRDLRVSDELLEGT